MPLAAKIAPLPPKSDRKNRIARVSAKRPKEDKKAKEDRDEEDGIEPEEVPEAETPEAKPSRPDNGTYLSMYFKDMAMLDVLRPEEEFTSAREIETLEIMLWETVLSHAPVIGRVIEAIATVPDYVATAELKALAKSASPRSGAASSVVRRRPIFESGPYFFLSSRICAVIVFHCRVSSPSSRSIAACSAVSSPCSRAICASSSRLRLRSLVSST